MRSATFDPTRRYRYRLVRRWARGPRVAFVMLNPSAADEIRDDPTIRRCVGFARAWGAGAVEIVNLFGLRSADPRALGPASDPVGPDNDRHVARAIRRADLVVCAWGTHPGARRRLGAIARLLRGRDPRCLGVTRDGSPRHPLYLAAATEPVPFLIGS